MMEGECTVVLEAPVAGEGKKQTRTSWRTTTVLLAFTLCLAAAAAAVLLFNTHNKVRGPQEDSNAFHHTLRELPNMKAAIHVQGRHNPTRKMSVEWQTNVDESHSQGGLMLKNNEIVIPQSGLYFVYSQASFQVSCSGADSSPMVHLSHAVKRWSDAFSNDNRDESYRTILYSARTACQRTTSDDTDGYWYTAVYNGAVFKLNRGDRLKTQMEEEMLNLLDDEPGQTFFGVFAL